MTEKKPEIIYTTMGTGYVLAGKIYLNEALKKYPALHDQVYEHELKHLKGEDWRLDFREKFNWDLYKFILTHPSAWPQLLPFWIDGNIFVYDTTMMIVWTVIVGVVLLIRLAAKWLL